MAEIMAWPLNLTTYAYNAQDVMRWMAGKTSGIYGQEGNCQVITKSGMVITVQMAGKIGGWLSNQGLYGIAFWNDSDLDLTVETADGVNPRIDRVVVSWHIPQQATVPSISIRKGTPSSSPVAPALINNGEYAEICLAEISVPAGATSIASYNITDTRLNEALCGLVSMGIEKIPTSGLEEQFWSWFNSLKANLEGDVAVNLQTQITNLLNQFNAHAGNEEIHRNHIWKTVTLTRSGWNSSNQQTVSVTGITASGSGLVKPAPVAGDSYTAYTEAGIRALPIQSDGKLIFQCESVPSVNISVVVEVVS